MKYIGDYKIQNDVILNSLEEEIMKNITNIALFAKSFYLLGDSLNFCYDCKYCRLNCEKCEEKHYYKLIIPLIIYDN